MDPPAGDIAMENLRERQTLGNSDGPANASSRPERNSVPKRDIEGLQFLPYNGLYMVCARFVQRIRVLL